ncbi:roadblock/LC7 domain-containing protein [Aquimarina hainanensis]|uniref:Roadblock/LC7 domain-containing protein n=1 Tax=Aquimarina hainanensis TaxID=1578017 RepID=A0ABW5N5Q7_9FLAO|nr:roadblock/LC7 domain-containing protein [Aquimarina sp. TRL1]QKX03879.1 hypothetical protein HN014_02815 [Aquimarina sp. TRL1]
MSEKTPLQLDKVLEDTGADAALLLDLEGNVISASHVDYEQNIAAMVQMIYAMGSDLSQDLKNGELEQLLVKASAGFFVVNKHGEDAIIVIFSKEVSKIGRCLKMINTL